MYHLLLYSTPHPNYRPVVMLGLYQVTRSIGFSGNFWDLAVAKRFLNHEKANYLQKSFG